MIILIPGRAFVDQAKAWAAKKDDKAEIAHILSKDFEGEDSEEVAKQLQDAEDVKRTRLELGEAIKVGRMFTVINPMPPLSKRELEAGRSKSQNQNANSQQVQEVVGIEGPDQVLAAACGNSLWAQAKTHNRFYIFNIFTRIRYRF